MAKATKSMKQVRENGGAPFPRRQRHWKAIYQPCYGSANAQDTLNGMVESVSGIVRQLRVFNES
jgi:hypothetical protein